MKMVKSLLLGSTAGLVAVAGAQAADLPVKAKPVEYVKVCSLYGAGYYYMPGSDICLKLGGYVRYQLSWAGGNISSGPMAGAIGRQTRTDTLDLEQRVRAVITVDTRQQTAYGTLRTYTLLGFQQDTTVGETTAPLVYMTRGFIQVAGFTIGKATSFFDIYPNASFAYNAGLVHVPDTGDAGKILFTYTAQFGNGVSASIGIEQNRRASVVNVVAGAYNFTTLGAPTSSSLGGIAAPAAGAPGAGTGLPDIVGNVRIDQAWGSVLAGFALHDASAGYYGAGTENLGHPSSTLGWAATAGAIINLPFLAPGDRFSFQYVYSEGAIRYASVTPSGATQNLWRGSNVGWGFWEDAVYGAAPGSVQLTTAWSIGAAVEHLWTPALRTSLYGSYVNISHNATATALICGVTPTGILAGTWGGPGCNPNWSQWNIGTRTQWEPVKGWIMGVDVLYQSLKTASANAAGTLVLSAASGAKPAGVYAVGDQSAWVFTFRTQRDYHP